MGGNIRFGGMVAVRTKAPSAPNALEISVTTMPKGPGIESRRAVIKSEPIPITNVISMYQDTIKISERSPNLKKGLVKNLIFYRIDS